VQLVAVKKSGSKWIARQLKHADLRKARLEVEQSDQESLKFTRLEDTSGLLWVETSTQECPQVVRDIVPNRPVRWSTQIVPCDSGSEAVQQVVPTPLAGACSCRWQRQAIFLIIWVLISHASPNKHDHSLLHGLLLLLVQPCVQR
jgi:hypothetical protein